MAQHLYLVLLLAAACLFGQIWTQSNFTSIVSPVEKDNTAAISLHYDFGKKQAVFYQLITNFTDASFVDLSNITVFYNMQPYNLTISQGSYNATYNGNGNNVEVFGQVIDPCVFASPGATATLSFDATSNVAGEITSALGSYEVVGIQNATAFEYTSPAPIQVPAGANNHFQESRFYFLVLNANGGESFGLEATSTEDILLSIAGFGNCPTLQFTDQSPYWSGSVSANQTVTTSVVASNETEYVWVLVQGNKQATVALTWTYLGSTPVASSTPQSSSAPESSSAPGQTPSAPSKDLPTWATALLVVFGIVIAALLIVVIVMCVKNRRRSTYQDV